MCPVTVNNAINSSELEAKISCWCQVRKNMPFKPYINHVKRGKTRDSHNARENMQFLQSEGKCNHVLLSTGKEAAAAMRGKTTIYKTNRNIEDAFLATKKFSVYVFSNLYKVKNAVNEN